MTKVHIENEFIVLRVTQVTRVIYQLRHCDERN